MNTRRAISPLIATLLLIAIAVSASVLTYSWVQTMVTTQATQAQTQVRIENVSWSINPAGDDTATIRIRNTGSVPVTIESTAVKENKAGATYYYASTPLVLDMGESKDVTWGSAASRGTGTDPTATFIGNAKSYYIRVTAGTGFYAETVTTTPS